MILVLSILLGAATALYISAPFWWHRMAALPLPMAAAKRPETDRVALMERRDALLRDLKDLEFDLEMGKIEPDDYAQLRATSAAAAAEVLQSLEVVTPPAGGGRKRRKGANNPGATESANTPPSHMLSAQELEAEVEILVARARQQLTPSTKMASGAVANERVRAPDSATGWQCAACGRAMPDADRFCGSCGQPRPV